jgi:FlaA1/EpsC-like NDP-sugar epimerase
VLQAAALGNEGEVFVLDMGEPVRVFDLAMDLIRLSGLEPDTDIEVRVTGARPGEKLYEELFFKGDEVTPTIHPKILRARDAESSHYNAEDLVALIAAARENRSAGRIRRLLLKLVPEYAGTIDTGEYGVMGGPVTRDGHRPDQGDVATAAAMSAQLAPLEPSSEELDADADQSALTMRS